MALSTSLTVPLLIALLLALGAVGYFLGRSRAIAASAGKMASLHSRPGYHAAFVFIWTVLPSVLLMAAWSVAEPLYVTGQGYKDFPAAAMENEDEAKLRMSMVETIADGYKKLPEDKRSALTYGVADTKSALESVGEVITGTVEPYMPIAAKTIFELREQSRVLMWAVVGGLSLLGLLISLARIAPKVRARNEVETVVRVILIAASAIAILTTFGIVFSMVFETMRFFEYVPPQDFFFSTTWNPGFGGASGSRGSGGEFGLLPLLFGTLYISLIALLIAVPVGLYAAIYMAEFASERFRAIAKPILEVLAGIPTIVYGFFALVTVGPAIQAFVAWLGATVFGADLEAGSSIFNISAASVLVAGIVMGIMIIPFVSSLSDDIITAVPRSLRDGSLGLGATKAETVRQVVLPAALPGIVAAVLLAASRAIGETMIVVLAAGAAARISASPFEEMTTVTVMIVKQLTGDVEFTSPQALVAYALGLTLFVITLAMNIYALRIVRRYREQYE